MSGRTHSETGPAGRLAPPVGVISIPIPCSLGCQCDGHLPRPQGRERRSRGPTSTGPFPRARQVAHDALHRLCMGGWTQSEHGPGGRLKPSGGVISVPIPCFLGCHCDGEMGPAEQAEARGARTSSPPQRGGDASEGGRGGTPRTRKPETSAAREQIGPRNTQRVTQSIPGDCRHPSPHPLRFAALSTVAVRDSAQEPNPTRGSTGNPPSRTTELRAGTFSQATPVRPTRPATPDQPP